MHVIDFQKGFSCHSTHNKGTTKTVVIIYTQAVRPPLLYPSLNQSISLSPRYSPGSNWKGQFCRARFTVCAVMTSEFLMTGHGHWVNDWSMTSHDWCDRRNPFSRGPVFAHSTLISRGRPNHDWKKPNSEWRTANAPSFLTNNSTSESSAAPDPQVPCLTSVLNSLKTLKSMLSYSILWAMVGANNEVFPPI